MWCAHLEGRDATRDRGRGDTASEFRIARTFLSATRVESDLRMARWTTEKWPLPMAFSIV